MKVTGLPKEKIEIMTTWTGGGFGGKSYPDSAVDAMVISKIMQRPVKVLWTREDDFTYDYFRPGSLHRLKAGIDEHGKPVAWAHKIACDSAMSSIQPEIVETGLDDTSYQGVHDTFYGFEQTVEFRTKVVDGCGLLQGFAGCRTFPVGVQVKTLE